MIGRTVSHFRVLERLGSGGMGVVYLAEDLRLGRTVVLKFIAPAADADPGARARLEREARAASALTHPNICPVHEIGESDEGELFICMGHCSGGSLQRRLSAGPLPLRTALRIAHQMASALAAAHAADIVHRDVKPANIMLSGETAMLVDFGLAKIAGAGTRTRPGTVVGTAAYMSPEQAAGENVDHRTDLWSLGVVLYEMLAGARPFGGDSELAVLRAVLESDPAPLRDLRPDLPSELEAVIARCLAKDPDERYQRATDLVRDLERLGDELGADLLRLESWPTAAQAVPRRRGLVWMARIGLLAAGLLVAALGVRWAPELLTRDGGRSIRHVAVLPLSNIGDDPGAQPLCDGLTEVLTGLLSDLESPSGPLLVVPASEVRGAAVSTAIAARRNFGVDHTLGGSVQSDGQRTVVTLVLADARRQRQLRSEVIRLEHGAGLPVHERVVAALEHLLGLELPPGRRARALGPATTDPVACDLYVRAQGLLALALSRRDVDRAVELLRQAVEREPTYALAWCGLTEAYVAAHAIAGEAALLEAAETASRRALALDDQLPAAHVARARVLLAGNRPEQALSPLTAALELQPHDAETRLILAEAYTELGRGDDADRELQRAVEQQPDSWIVHHRVAKTQRELGRLDAAERSFGRVVELNPGSAVGYNGLGACAFARADLEAAEAAFRRSLEAQPSYLAYSNLGTLAFYEGDFARAAEAYREALAIEPSDHRVWGFLAECYAALPGRSEAAREATTRAAELAERYLRAHPGLLSVLCDLASYRQQLGRHAEARELLERIPEEGRTDPAIAFAAASVWEGMGERTRALEALRPALADPAVRSQVEAYPGFSGLLRDPRFEELLTPSADPRRARPRELEEGDS